MDYGCIGAPFEVKFAEEGGKTGSFEGYGAVFGNMDSHGDVIEPGAFAASLLGRLKAGRRLPPMYMNHGAALGNPHEPIGVWEAMSEDTNGLNVKGRLIGLDTEKGKWNYAQMRDGAMQGLSIGYSVPPHGSKAGSGKAGEPRRHLKTINLREVSLVDDPSNPAALVYFMKSRWSGICLADEIKTPRDFEQHLRDVGYSNAAAKAITAGGFKQRPDPRDEDGIGDHIRSRLGALATLIQK